MTQTEIQKINKSKKDGSQGELDDTEETGIEDSE